MFCCLKTCLNGIPFISQVPARTKDKPIQLDPEHIGNEVVVVKAGRRVCGSGCAVGTAPIVQNKAYFEVKLQQDGVWAVGLATQGADLNKVVGGADKESWCLNSDGTIRHNNVELYHLSKPAQDIPPADLLTTTVPANGIEKLPEPDTSSSATMPVEGDTIGIAFDHIELNYFLNGKNMEVPVRNIKGTVYPALYVDDGAILDVIFDNFLYPPPSGYEKIMIEQSLL